MRFIATVIFAGFLACNASSSEDFGPGVKAAAGAELQLLPRSYRLSLISTYGRLKGRSVNGQLTLTPGSPDDKSPRTGLRADDRGRVPLLIGWSDVAFRDVGVPLCRGDPEPTSRDPVYLGVVVITSQMTSPARPRNAPILLVGTHGNVRDGSRSQMTDGCGIGLFVQRAEGACFHGLWREWGMARRPDGDWTSDLGTFSVCSG